MDEAELAQVLSVRVGAEGDLPAILGERRIVDETLRFTPRFPWRTGLDYRATLSLPGAPSAELRFRIPAVASEATTTVAAIYPAADSIPANLLRFYVQFSAPMSADDPLPHVQLLDGEKHRIEHAFVETTPLWDPSRTRLTLICHPGRIKRGLELHERLGPPLREGMRVTLVVSGDLRDAWGQPLAAEAGREYRVTAPDRSAPDPSSWSVQAPRPGSLDPLRIEFGEALDLQLIDRMLTLRGVDGVPSVDTAGGAWEFRPRRPWDSEAVELLIAGELEDLAGNRVDAPFEVTGSAPPGGGPFRLHIDLADPPR